MFYLDTNAFMNLALNYYMSVSFQINKYTAFNISETF